MASRRTNVFGGYGRNVSSQNSELSRLKRKLDEKVQRPSNVAPGYLVSIADRHGQIQGTNIKSTDVLLQTGAQGNLNMGNNQINNVSNPTKPQDVASKYYVDDLLQELADTAILADGQNGPKVDISWSGKKLKNLGEPINTQDAATKGYVDKCIKQVLSQIKML